MYLIFATEDEANIAAEQIAANVRAYLAKFNPGRVDEHGHLVSIAADGKLEPSAARTERIANPTQYVQGWGFGLPPATDTGQITPETLLAGVGGTILEVVEVIPKAIEPLPVLGVENAGQ